MGYARVSSRALDDIRHAEIAGEMVPRITPVVDGADTFPNEVVRALHGNRFPSIKPSIRAGCSM